MVSLRDAEPSMVALEHSLVPKEKHVRLMGSQVNPSGLMGRESALEVAFKHNSCSSSTSNASRSGWSMAPRDAVANAQSQTRRCEEVLGGKCRKSSSALRLLLLLHLLADASAWWTGKQRHRFESYCNDCFSFLTSQLLSALGCPLPY